MKNYTFQEFKKFLREKCVFLTDFRDGKYDQKIYNWFDLGKPKEVKFYEADGSLKTFRKIKK